MAQAYVFDAELVEYPGVIRTVAVRGDQTLADLHGVLREAFEWDDDPRYSFWLGGDAEPATTTESVDRLGLRVGQEIAYAFESGDEWRVTLKLADIRSAGDEDYPQVLERVGAPPEPEVEEEELGAGD